MCGHESSGDRKDRAAGESLRTVVPRGVRLSLFSQPRAPRLLSPRKPRQRARRLLHASFPFRARVEVQRAGTDAWLQIKRLDTSVCPGDRLRTGPLARAALFVEPETLVRVDRNTTIALSVTTAEIVVEFFQDDVARASLDAHSCGAGYFITRFPKKFRVSAPHLNAAVEGTEFQVALRCDATELAVLRVRCVPRPCLPARRRVVSGGQMLVASPTAPAAFSTVIKPTDAVQWVLYYPPLSDAKAEAEVPTRRAMSRSAQSVEPDVPDAARRSAAAPRARRRRPAGHQRGARSQSRERGCQRLARHHPHREERQGGRAGVRRSGDCFVARQLCGRGSRSPTRSRRLSSSNRRWRVRRERRRWSRTARWSMLESPSC